MPKKKAGYLSQAEADNLNAIRASAESKLDELQAELNRLDTQVHDSSLDAYRNINSWQAWLGAVSFSLAAISGVVLISQLVNYWALFSTVIFLFTGVSIAISTKKRFEQDAIEATTALEGTRPFLDRQKQLAWMIYHEPHRYSEINPQLEAAKKVSVEYSINRIDLLIEQNERNTVLFDNDLWVALVTTGIYILLASAGIVAYDTAGLLEALKPAIFILPWMLLMLIIVNDALKSGKAAKAAGLKRLEELRKWRTSLDEYREAIIKSVL